MRYDTKISLIAAIASSNRALGRDNKLIYRISQDLKRFRQLTQGHAIIMGRKTFESIGHPLPNRTNIVVTRDVGYKVEGAIVVHSLTEAIEIAQKRHSGDEQSEDSRIKERSWTSQDDDTNRNEVFIIGGGQIYQEAIAFANKLYLTVVEGNPQADTFFPEYENKGFKVVKEEKGEEGEYKFKFVDLKKRGS